MVWELVIYSLILNLLRQSFKFSWWVGSLLLQKWRLSFSSPIITSLSFHCSLVAFHLSEKPTLIGKSTLWIPHSFSNFFHAFWFLDFPFFSFLFSSFFFWICDYDSFLLCSYFLRFRTPCFCPNMAKMSLFHLCNSDDSWTHSSLCITLLICFHFWIDFFICSLVSSAVYCLLSWN